MGQVGADFVVALKRVSLRAWPPHAASLCGVQLGVTVLIGALVLNGAPRNSSWVAGGDTWIKAGPNYSPTTAGQRGCGGPIQDGAILNMAASPTTRMDVKVSLAQYGMIAEMATWVNNGYGDVVAGASAPIGLWHVFSFCYPWSSSVGTTGLSFGIGSACPTSSGGQYFAVDGGYASSGASFTNPSTGNLVWLSGGSVKCGIYNGNASSYCSAPVSTNSYDTGYTWLTFAHEGMRTAPSKRAGELGVGMCTRLHNIPDPPAPRSVSVH